MKLLRVRAWILAPKCTCILEGLVVYVPDIKTNLLSLGQLLHKGFVMTMDDNCLKMFDKNHKLVKSKSISELNFQIGMNILKHQSFAIVKNKV